VTDLPAIARESALNFEARKIAYRQTKDGVVVSLLVHPDEVPNALATAPLGSRYVTAMVELNDDETPKRREVMRATMSGEERPEREPEQAPARARITLAQRAGMLCDTVTFQRYLYDNHMLETHDFGEAIAVKHAAIAVRLICGVKSRSEIIPNTPAGQAFEELHAKYTVWLRHPEVA
jgi:hypothetical protein